MNFKYAFIIEYLVGAGVVNGGRLGILTGGAIPGTICGEAEAALVAAGGVLPSWPGFGDEVKPSVSEKGPGDGLSGSEGCLCFW